MAAALPDRIDSARLVLRKPQLADAARIFLAYTQDLKVARYMIWRPHTSQDESVDFISECIRAWGSDERRAYVLALRGHEHEPVGMLDVRVIGGTVDIGYVLAPAHWGSGLMPEAIHAFAGVALAIPGIFRIQATCDVDNIPSARALEKSGFHLEGRLDRYSLHPNVSDEPRACYMYALCR
jgi:[ribosomal protein S5]-alanine N-acetyltransferase